jgi:hypothetical protein
MGYWTDLSIQFASQRNYLDEIFERCSSPKETNRQLDLYLKDGLQMVG